MWCEDRIEVTAELDYGMTPATLHTINSVLLPGPHVEVQSVPVSHHSYWESGYAQDHSRCFPGRGG